MNRCYYADPGHCGGKLWRCKTCGEKYCQNHSHDTDKGKNVECVACESARRQHWACGLKLYAVHNGEFIEVWTFCKRDDGGGPILVNKFGSGEAMMEEAAHYGWEAIQWLS